MSSNLFIKAISSVLVIPIGYVAYSSGIFNSDLDDSDASDGLSSVSYFYITDGELDESELDSQGLLANAREKKKSASKRKLKIDAPVVAGDLNVYKSHVPKQTIAGTKLPSEFISSNIYQANSSGDLEKNTTKFFCTSMLFTNGGEDGISGVHPKGTPRGPLNSEIHKGKAGDNMTSACLDVIGGKEGYGNKGRGGGRMIMTAQNYNYATIMMVTLEADDGKFVVEGNLYGLQHTNENNKKGNILAHEQTSKMEIKEGEEEYLGIKPGKSVNMVHNFKDGSGNGFDLSDRNNICGIEECTKDEVSDDASGSHAIGNFKKDLNGGKSLETGSSNYTGGSDSSKGLFKGFKNQHHDGMKGTLNSGWFYGGGRELEGTPLSRNREPVIITFS